MSLDLDRVMRGRVWKFGDSIETDAINPYYRYPTMEELKQHTMEAYRRLSGSNGALPVTEEAARRTLTLPLWTDMTQAHVARVGDAITRIHAYLVGRAR